MTTHGTPAPALDLEAYLRAARDDAERALAVLPLDDVPPRVAEAVLYAVRGGGKRLRPILCAAAWRAVARAEPPPAVHRAASSLELIHAYSLVHDDLPFMDDDDLRRGRPTTHRAFGVATATIAGALMIPLAFRVLAEGCAALRLPETTRADAIGALAEGAGAGGMVGGQWLDVGAEGRTPARAELERIHAMKTGALIRASVILGGTLAGADGTAREALAVYGAAVGLAFQIADDLLDARGDAAAIGKTTGRDAALAKSTYPGLLGLEGAERLAAAAAGQAVDALAAAGLRTPELEALARHAVARTS